MHGPYRARDWRLRLGLIALVIAVGLVAGGLWLRSGSTRLPGIPSPTKVGVAVLPSSSIGSSSSLGPGSTGTRRSSHVWLIMLENKEYTSLLGNPEAPYFNSLVARYGLATNYYATGHPSQPNYVALVAGSVAGVTADSEYHLSRGSLFSQLDAAGLPWREYAQDVPRRSASRERRAAADPTARALRVRMPASTTRRSASRASPTTRPSARTSSRWPISTRAPAPTSSSSRT